MTVDEFIAEWWGKPGGSEKSNFAPFIFALCEVLGESGPGQSEKGKLGAYEFEGSVPKGSFRSLDASGAIDLYKRGCFIMEAKQSYLKPEQTDLDLGEPTGPRAPSGARYDRLMRDARSQAENYAKNLPASEPVAPFLIVCDIGRAFEIYHDSAGNGRGYQFFPDKQSYRIELKDLASDRKLKGPDKTPLELLKAIWSDPRSIDPRYQAADVTREVAKRLASVSQYIEEGVRLKSAGASAQVRAEEIEESALFLMRILFCMFAEDIGLLPEGKFKDFLKRAESNDQLFANGLSDLWQKMGAPDISPRFAHAVEGEVRYFNGGLFSETARTYALGGFVIHDLYEAARQNWRKVEPAIFGTLLEQALSAEERAKLGAHYTPRPYVETLVRATIMDVLEPEWREVEGGEEAGLLERAQAFHERLSSIRVLDPACGTGNFLYVSMELMQGLESKVIETIQMLGGEASPKVGPHQFHGLEKNPRAAKIAELVLWIGWLRNRLHDDPDSVPQPVLAESASINFGRHGGYDAVLKMNEMGEPDLAAPMPPAWPEAEYIVGNPPFIGGKGIGLRATLGDDYAEALWAANVRVPKSADFVMQWWDRAAHILVAKDSPLRRFGFVTTNSITQEFSRRVIAGYLSKSSPERGGGPAEPVEGAQRAASHPSGEDSASSTVGPLHHPSDGPPPRAGEDHGLSLVMAIPDHPWIKASKDSAAVRIAMTVAERGLSGGELRQVTRETGLDSDEPEIELRTTIGHINVDLTTGPDATSAMTLTANQGLSYNGMMLAGQGFKLSEAEAKSIAAEEGKDVSEVLRSYIGGSELLNGWKQQSVIDFCGLTEDAARQRFPVLYQHLWKTVKPERDRNRDRALKQNWWVFGRVRSEFRQLCAEISRYIGTTETAKHRVFQFIATDTLPDHKVVAIGSDDSFALGVLQSTVHVEWSLRAGGWLGVGNDSVYVKSKVFDPFPFPDPTPEQRAVIAELAEELDATRKAALAETEKLTMTELYNLRAKLRSGEAMSDAEQRRAVKARAGIVDRLHEQIDQAVADAYGWGEEWKAGKLGPSEIVARLVALNHERAAEEAAGTVRWLRPEYQKKRLAEKRQDQRAHFDS